jgi:hypothetical protein
MALWGILILALGYGALILVERLTTQELTRASNPSTQESVCLMWKPRFLKGDGVCDLDLRNPQDKIVDTARLGTLDAGFEALQQFGQLDFQDQTVTVISRRNSEVVRRFTVRNGRFSPAE